jgi:hypothetical protein
LGRSPAIRIAARGPRLVGDLDVRHGVDQLGDEVVLGALHQGRHRDREADPDRDAQDRDHRLPAAPGEVGERDLEDQAHRHSAALATRAPSARSIG